MPSRSSNRATWEMSLEPKMQVLLSVLDLWQDGYLIQTSSQFLADMGGYQDDSDNEWWCEDLPIDEEWKVVSGKKSNRNKLTESVEDYVSNNNTYATLTSTNARNFSGKTITKPKPPSKKHVRHDLRLLEQQESKFVNECIDNVEH